MLTRQPLTLRYRQGNPNVFSVTLDSGDGEIVPTSSLAIKLEIRASEAGRILYAVPLAIVPGDAGRLMCTLPAGMGTGRYVAGLLFDHTTEPDWHRGICYIEILPQGAIVATPDVSGLNLTISELEQILNVELDNTASAAIVAAYANQVRADAQAVQAAIDGAGTSSQDAIAAAASATQSKQAAATSASAASTSAGQAGTAKTASEAARDIATNHAGIAQTAAGTATTQAGIATQAAQGVQGATARINAVPGGLGNFDINDGSWLSIWCGNSTVEQSQGSGFGFDRITQHRQPGERLDKLLGVINFGGSGNSLENFITAPLATLPVIPTDGNKGILNWDYYGHKPTAAISLKTALKWREGKAAHVHWTIPYGINDLILYAATGNLTQDQISSYITTRLRVVAKEILTQNPTDRITFMVENPMTARPYSTSLGFPSPTAYPTFGQNLATDQTLVEKWNQGLRNGYLALRNEIPGVDVFDTHEKVFGQSNTTLVAGTQLPLLGDLVHPSADGYIARENAWVDHVAPSKKGLLSRRREAELRAGAVGGNPWDYYAGYFSDNSKFEKAFQCELVNIGPNYVDLGISLGDFISATNNLSAIYVQIGDRVAQYFPVYNAAAISATSIRLTGLSPNTPMQGAGNGQTVEVYLRRGYQPIAGDLYIDQQAKAAKEYYTGFVGGAGNGYIDLQFTGVTNRVSTKFLSGLTAGKLVVGAGVNTTVSLNSATINRTGTTDGRTIRILRAGDNSAYSGKSVAITFADDVPSPKIHEAVFSERAVIPHAQGNRQSLHIPVAMADGAIITAFLTEVIPQAITVDVFTIGWPSGRTAVGTITIPANSDRASLTSGNPTSIPAGQFYEYVITSATSQTTGIVGLEVKPN
jgi:lysophospholipase L1-like esterase